MAEDRTKPNPNYMEAPFTGMMWTPETGVVPFPPPPARPPDGEYATPSGIVYQVRNGKIVA